MFKLVIDNRYSSKVEIVLYSLLMENVILIEKFKDILEYMNDFIEVVIIDEV